MLSMGCSTQTKVAILPPQEGSSQKPTQKEDSNDTVIRAKTWQEKYQNALKLISEEACPLFLELANEEEFPLSPLAKLRAQMLCPLPTLNDKNIGPLDFQTIEEWQKPLVVEIMLNKAIEKNDDKEISFWALEKSKFFLPPFEKLQWTERALKSAEALDDQEMITQLRKRREDIAPRFILDPKKNQWFEVANDFRRAREFNRARQLFEKILKTKSFSFDDQLKALQGLRMIDKNSRSKEDYLVSTERKARFVFDRYRLKKTDKILQKKLLEVYIDLMRTYWTQSQILKASQVLSFLERELQKKIPIGEVYWLRGRMQEEKQEFKAATAEFEKALNEKPTSSEQTEKYLWHLAWNYRKLKKFDLAISRFQELKRITSNDFQRAKYQFWLAETLRDSNNQKEAQTEFVDLIEQDPLGFYGMVSHRQAGIPLKKPINSDTTTFRMPSALEEILDLPLTEWLLRVESQTVTQNYLDWVTAKYKKQKSTTTQGWLSLFHAFARAGSYLQLFELLGQLPQEQRAQILKEWPEVLFPRPYLELVKAAEAEFGVGQDLIYAIMRQESAFNPVARSWADAFGLLQMLPEIARKQLPLGELASIRDEDLFRPEINIPIGASFIQKLLKQYDGRFIMTAAAYNASDRAIQGWIKTRYRGNTLEFIEDIPYEETKGYIKLVMRNLIFYRLLDLTEDTMAFPEELLKI